MLKTINIKEETHKKLKMYSAETGSSIAEVVEAAVNAFINPNRRIIKKKDSQPGILDEGRGMQGYEKQGLTKKAGELNADDYV